jgi:hypothetical protein
MEDIDIRCPWCGIINEEIYDFKENGARRCYKCKCWFEWRSIKRVTYKTNKIIQNEKEN